MKCAARVKFVTNIYTMYIFTALRYGIEIWTAGAYSGGGGKGGTCPSSFLEAMPPPQNLKRGEEKKGGEKSLVNHNNKSYLKIIH